MTVRETEAEEALMRDQLTAGAGMTAADHIWNIPIMEERHAMTRTLTEIMGLPEGREQ